MTPTKAEISLAKKVLKHYQKKADKLAVKTQQEKPYEWARGAEVWVELLSLDPDKIFDDYEDEYDEGHR